MDDLSARLRPYTPADLPDLAELLQAAHAWPPVAQVSPRDIATRWERRHVDPERDLMMLPDPSGGLAAFYSVSRFGDPNHRAGLELAVHPDWRCRGIGSWLYERGERKARELGAWHLTIPVYLKAGEERPESTGFLHRRGYFPNSSYWQMRLDDLPSQPPARWPRGFTFRTISVPDLERDTECWAALIRAAFLEPSSGERIMGQITEPGCSPNGYFFAVEERTGREVGTSRARIDVMGGQPVGYVGTVGVLPQFRNQGLATALIAQTLQYLVSQGMDMAVLGVDGSNVNARRLYENLGWRATHRTVHYWKTLLPLPGPVPD
jgi:mycothiol synthase